MIDGLPIGAPGDDDCDTCGGGSVVCGRCGGWIDPESGDSWGCETCGGNVAATECPDCGAPAAIMNIDGGDTE